MVVVSWATLVAIFCSAPCRGTSIHLPSASLRATKPDVARLIYQRPSFTHLSLKNGSLVMHELNATGSQPCNTVCGSSMDYAMIADVSGSVEESGVENTKIF